MRTPPKTAPNARRTAADGQRLERAHVLAVRCDRRRASTRSHSPDTSEGWPNEAQRGHPAFGTTGEGALDSDDHGDDADAWQAFKLGQRRGGREHADLQ